MSFLRFGNFSAIILLTVFPIPLAWIFSFDAHGSQDWSFQFLHIPFTTLQSFLLSTVLVFSLVSIFVFESEVLSYSSLLEWLSTIFFIWLKEFFVSRVSVDTFFFLKLSYLCSKFLFHILYCLLYFINLFLKNISLVSFQCLLKSSLSSFSCFCIFLSF
jgi:hypothetical protein